MKKSVVVRFAPSPTGYLHIGGARTAIYNWLYAQKTGGKFILRIEDTDAERSTKESIQGIVDGLKWLGITWDEGPYFQTAFIRDHQAAAQKLLESGHAYKCFCTKEELDEKREAVKKNKTTFLYDGTCRNLTAEQIAQKEAAGRPHTLRLKVPQGPGAVGFTDAVYGHIEKQYADLEDFIIVRSNGHPLYVLSNAVDDIRDGVTHIIRGQDGLANTPKQILIYQALGATIPTFAHMSLTLDPQKAKISKRRHGEIVAIHFYRERGFLPWAMVNFLVLLGWATPESKELFSQEELITAFNLEGISRTNSVFDVRKDDPKFFTDPKALNINSHYLRTLPVEELIPHVKTELEKAALWNPAYEGDKRQWFRETVELIRARFVVLTDFSSLGRAFFSDDFPMDEKAVEKNLRKHPGLKTHLPELARQIAGLDTYSAQTLETVIRTGAKQFDVKPGILVNVIRTAVTGQAVGPGFLEVLLAIGQAKVCERLEKSIELFE